MPVDPNTAYKPVEQSTPPPQAGGPKAVLVADADYKEGGAIRNSLEGCGYDVSVWTDAADARERLRARNFNVVVVSTNLKQQMDALLDDLRPRKIPPKVVLIADEDEGDAAARCFLRTVVVVNRPFKVGEIADIVEHLIGPPA